MRFSISRSTGLILSLMILFCALCYLPSAPSLAVTSNLGSLKLDFDGSDGYAGDYVVIYNPALTNDTPVSSGTLTGKLAASVSQRSINSYDSGEKRNIEFVPPNFVYPPKLSNSNQLITTKAYNTGEMKQFHVFTTMGANTLVSKTFTLISKGTSCYVWTIPQESYTITSEQADQIANEYDTKIAPDMLLNFGSYYDPEASGRLNILVYNLLDDFGSSSNSYYSGFFWSGDFVDTYGNAAAMIHVDTYPTINYNGSSSLTEALGTIVHEMQHLINFSAYWRNSNSPSGSDGWMDTWLDETCSMAAEESIYPNSVISKRVSYLNSYPSQYTNGYSSYSWNGDLSCYAMNCLFGQYIKTQTGGYQAFKSMIDVFASDSLPSEEKAIATAVSGSALDGMSLSDIILAFRIALIANDPDDYNGKYGFKGDTSFDDVPKMLYTSNTPARLFGGGAIVIQPKDSKFTLPADCGAGLKCVGITLSDSSEEYRIDSTNNTISNIAPNMTANEFKEAIAVYFPGSISISLNTQGYVGTGCKVSVYNDGSTSPLVYTVILYGDVNGTGTIDVADATAVMNHIVGISTLSGVYFTAANANHDSGVNIGDATAILSSIVGINSISQIK